MPKKIDPQIRIQRRDLKDLIRDEIYGADVKGNTLGAYVIVPKEKVKAIAKKIANRAIVGH